MVKNLTITGLLAIALSILTYNSIAQTNVSGVLNANTEWTTSGSPYILSDTLVVPAGITLTIRPGVTIRGIAVFNGYNDYITRTSIIVEGNVIMNGEKGDSVDMSNNKIVFRTTNLTNSQISFVKFSFVGSTEIQNDPAKSSKNSGVLNIHNSTFRSYSGAFVRGDTSSAMLSIKNCSFVDNSKVRSSRWQFPGNSNPPKIEISDCYFDDSSILGHGFINVRESIIRNSPLLEFVNISKSTISSSTFKQSMVMDSCDVNNSLLSLEGPLTISNSRILNVSTFFVNSGYIFGSKKVTLFNTVFTGVNVYDAIAVSGSVRIEKCTFLGYKRPILVKDIGADFYFKHNNFDGDWLHAFFNWGPCIDASENYWGTTDTTIVRSKTLGCVDISNPLASPSVDFELPSPLDPYLLNKSGQIQIGWTANGGSKTAGYKVYAFKNNKFALLGNAGNNNYFLSDQISENDLILVSANDSMADDDNDFSEGHEGPFSRPALKFLSETKISLHAMSSCADSLSATVVPSPNLEDNYYILQLSDTLGSFEKGTNLGSAQGRGINFSSKLPETIKYGHPYKVRVLSTKFNISSDPVEIIPSDNYTATFSSDEDHLCSRGGFLNIAYTGNAPKDAVYNWDFDAGSVYSGNGSGPFSVHWTTKGDRTISLQVSRGNCQSDVNSVIVPDARPELAFKIDGLICPNKNFQLEFTGKNYTHLSWSFPSSINVISGSNAGPYTLAINHGTGVPLSIRFTAINKTCASDTTLEIRYVPRTLPPADLYKVTIDPVTSRAILTWLQAPDWAWILKIGIHKNDNSAVTESLIEYFNATHVYKDTYVMGRYEDPEAYEEGQSYNVAWGNHCEMTTATNNFHQPIYLKVHPENGKVSLEWSKYKGSFDYESHRILRSIDGAVFQLIAEVGPEVTSFTDLTASPGSSIAYQIEILNSYVPLEYLNDGEFNSSKSNLALTELPEAVVVLGTSSSKEELILFPNPAKDFVKGYLKTGHGKSWRLIDLAGREVLSSPFTKEIIIDLSDQKVGIYTLQIETSDGVFTRKIRKL